MTIRSQTMRTNLLGAVLAAAVSVAVGACKPAGSVNMLDEKLVNIDLECLDDGGVSFSLSPWRVDMPKNGSIKWVLGKYHKVNQAEIKPADPAKWPFQDSSFTTKPGAPADGRNLKKGQPGGVYKYTVSTICDRGAGVKDTVIIDPDMIIPT
jgi:hypothetical protein